MIFALLSILSSCAIVILFREFGKYNLSLLQVIATNYIVCVLCGLAYTPEAAAIIAGSDKAWVPLALLQGVLFITLFFLIGTASQKIGVAYTGMITRVSVVIPTLVSFFAFGDRLTAAGWAGVALALVAIVLLHLKYFDKNSAFMQVPLGFLLSYSVILFFGTGLTDSIFKIFDHEHGGVLPENIFTIALFGVAGVLGVLAAAYRIAAGQTSFAFRNIIAGAALGVPNYFSILFLLKALKYIPGTVFYPFNNIGIMLALSVIGAAYYRERYKRASWAGLALACLAIFLISYEEIARGWAQW